MDNPRIEYYKNGNVKNRRWVDEYEQYHRINGPAYIEYYDNNDIKYECWWLNGKSHRFGGPAYISFNNRGTIISSTWFIYGNRIIEPFLIKDVNISKEQLIELKLKYG